MVLALAFKGFYANFGFASQDVASSRTHISEPISSNLLIICYSDWCLMVDIFINTLLMEPVAFQELDDEIGAVSPTRQLALTA